jgi:hypothetical protein
MSNTRPVSDKLAADVLEGFKAIWPDDEGLVCSDPVSLTRLTSKCRRCGQTVYHLRGRSVVRLCDACFRTR